MWAEAPKPYSPSRCASPAHPQRAIADQAGAEQRRHLLVVIAARQREAVALVCDGVLGIAAVDVAAGEAGVRAQVLAPAAAVLAHPVGPAQPRHPHALIRGADLPGARLHDANDLMAEDARRRVDRHLAVEQVQIRAADPAGLHLQQQLPLLRHGHGTLKQAQRLADPLEDHRSHRALARCLRHIACRPVKHDPVMKPA